MPIALGLPKLNSPLRPLCNTLALSLMLGVATNARAAPVGEVITGGSGSVERSGQVTSILQNSNRLAIDWDNFDIAADERVTFIQPDANSIALNRVLSNDPSRIAGQIDANGRIILTNPNGVIFSGGASVNVGSLIASGLDINADDFMAGDLDFSALENTDGVVINRGLINAAAGGDVVLLGKQVRNEGVVNAQMGSISLTAAEEAVITFDEDGLLGVLVSRDALEDSLGVDPAILNSGTLNAHRIVLNSRASADLFSDAVNHDQPAHLDVTVHDDGSFSLARSGDVINTGRLAASANAAGEGGSVELSGTDIRLSGQVRVDGARTETSAAAVSVDATSSVDMPAVIINSPTMDAANRVEINGRYLEMGGESRIHMGAGSLEMGERERTDFAFVGPRTRIQVADSSSTGTPASTGGEVSIHADRGIHVSGRITVQGGTEENGGGRLLLDSGDLLGFSSDVVLGTSAATAELTFNAKDLFIGEATSSRRISVGKLARGVTHARAQFNAQRDIIGFTLGENYRPSIRVRHPFVMRAALVDPTGVLDMDDIELWPDGGFVFPLQQSSRALEGTSSDLITIDTADSSSRSESINISGAKTVPVMPNIAAPGSNARPAGGSVTDGSGVIDYFQRATRIQQSSDQLAIDWDSFDIGDNHRVVFYQPDSQSVAFNRVLSNDPTRIYGELTANGRVVITSPGGIAIGKNASVNVGGLVASSLMLPTAGVPDSVWTFDAGANSGAVINLADIMVTSGGDVALLGAAVANDGVIQIDQGSVTLASASQATIDPGNLEEPLRVTVTEAAEGPALLDAAVMNLGDILTPAGFVSLLSRPLADADAQAIDTTGVTLKDNGSFEVATAPDVYIGGTIDVGGAVAAEYFNDGGGFRFAGTDVQLAGKVLVGAYPEGKFDEWQYEERGYGWPISRASDLRMDAARSVVITGTVQSRPANDNTLSIIAPYIGIEDGGTLSIGLGELTLGQPESTHRIFAGASTTIAADSWLGEFGPMYGTGGRITLDAQESIVLNGLVAANSRSDNSYQSYLDGGEITVNSQGKLGVHGALGAGSGARGTPGHITLRGEQLTLSDSDDTYVVSAQSLNAAALRGDVTLDGASSVVVDSESPVNVSMYRSLFIRAGRPGHPGDLDLSGLVIDNDSYRNSSVYIEGHNIIAPELASVVGRALNVFITATGDLYHPTRVFTTGGNYIAVVGGDITFAPEAVLATRSYGPGYKTHLEAGGDIDLRVGVNTSHEEDVTFVSPVPTTVIGDQVRVWVPKGEVDLNVQADTLWLAGGGRLQGKAQVDGFAHLDMAPGSAWTLTGDIGGVDVSFPGILVGPTHSVGGTLNIQDKGSLLLGDVSASNSAVINIRTDAEGRITQLTDTAINLERSKLHLGGGRGITLGAAGVFLDEFEFTQFTVDYGTDLVLDGPITQSAPGNLVRFNTTRPNQKTNVTVGENFSLAVGNKPAGSIKVGNAGSIINLAAYMPLPFMLGAGADVINLLSAYAGGVFIKQGQTNTINPYVPNQVQLDSQRSDPLSQLWSVDESFKWTVSVPDRLAVERSLSESGADQPRTSNRVSYMPWSGL